MATDVRGSTVVEANDWPPMAAQSACEMTVVLPALASPEMMAMRPAQAKYGMR